jgi:hypothetical protein
MIGEAKQGDAASGPPKPRTPSVGIAERGTAVVVDVLEGRPLPGSDSPGSSVLLQCALPYADAKERVSPVLFVALFREKEGSSVTLDAFLARRMQGPQIGKAPTKGRIEGLTLLGEYWLQSPDPKVVVIFTAESDGPMLELSAEWEENFDVTVVPASKVEDLMLS